VAEAANPSDTIANFSSRERALAGLRRSDAVFRVLTRGAAGALLMILGGVMVSLFIGALPRSRNSDSIS